MDVTCIVAANAGRARFFLRTGRRGRPEEINDMVNTVSRMRTADIETDDIDLRSASKSKHSVAQPTPSSNYQPHQTPQQHQTELFARSVADYLAQEHREGRFGDLVLIASPEFLGVLRKQLDANVLDAVTLEINKDYTQSAADRLAEQIEAHKP